MGEVEALEVFTHKLFEQYPAQQEDVVTALIDAVNNNGFGMICDMLKADLDLPFKRKSPAPDLPQDTPKPMADIIASSKEARRLLDLWREAQELSQRGQRFFR